MRTLKKTLCLVLVLAMMVGLCAMGASAAKIDDYKDKDTIQNKEAVAVLTAIGVFEGDDQGNFRGTATLNRAEGAALMTRFLAATGAGNSSFTDMAGHWAQPYVAYCEGSGIISGLGDGTFGPASPLTVVQFAKMMLCALGYDAAREGLIGNTWEVNTIKLINKLDLAAGLTNLDYNAPISRDAAAQMAYNTLRATMVEYVGGTDINVSTGGASVVVKDNIQATPVKNNSYDYRGGMNGGDYFDIIDEIAQGLGLSLGLNTMEFCENYFPNLKLFLSDADAFGKPMHTWWMGTSRKDVNYDPAKKIASELAGTVLAVYDTSMAISEKKIYADAKGSATATSLDLDVFENGTQIDDISVRRTAGTSFPFMAKYEGATIYLMDTDEEGDDDYGVGDALYVEYPLLAKVTKAVAATATADRTLNLTVYNNPTGTPVTGFVCDEFAQGDWLLVYPQGEYDDDYEGVVYPAAPTKDNIIEAKKADSAAGTLTKVTIKNNVASALTISGVNYTVGSAELAKLGPNKQVVASAISNYDLNTGMTAYLSNGFVLGVVSDAVAFADYIFVVQGDQADTTVSALDTDYSYLVAYLDMSAKLSEVKASAAAYEEGVATGWYKGTTVVGGKNSFIAAEEENVEDFAGIEIDELSPKNPKIADGIVANNKTTFLIRTRVNGVNIFRSYTGIASVPAMTGDLTVWGLVSYGNAAAVYVDATSGHAEIDTSVTIFLTNGGTPTSWEYVDGAKIYNYGAIVDGELKTLQSRSAELKAQGANVGRDLYNPTYSGGLLSSVSVADANNIYRSGSDVDIAYYEGTLTAGTEAKAVADNAVVYVYNAIAGILTVGTVEDLTEYGTIWTITSTAGTVSTIYFVPGVKTVNNPT